VEPGDIANREVVAKGIRILVREGLIVNFGHISYRPPGADWFLTLRHLHLGLESTGAADIIACDMQGRSIGSAWEASGERFIYTEIFARRPDIRAIAHFHPPMAIAFSIVGKPIIPVVLWAAALGDVPQYDSVEQIEKPQDGQALADALGDAKALVMQGHGAITVGQSVPDVCALAVLLEQNARTQHLASSMGEPRPIKFRGREHEFAPGFQEFSSVLWDHHQQTENSSFLSSFAV
jgi:ribulose-5-phosphate 4-epimerase/fuculose-1-phosphate aldolase